IVWRLRHSLAPPRTLSLLLPRPRPPTPTLSPYTTLFRSSPPIARLARLPGCVDLIAGNNVCTFSAIILIKQPVPPQGIINRFHRSEEHTSELQSRENLVCRLLLEKKKTSCLRPHRFYGST